MTDRPPVYPGVADGTPDCRGEIEIDDNVLIIKRIRVQHSGVDVPEDRREATDRALATHQTA